MIKKMRIEIMEPYQERRHVGGKPENARMGKLLGRNRAQ